MCHRWHTVNNIILYTQKSKWKNKNLPPALWPQRKSTAGWGPGAAGAAKSPLTATPGRLKKVTPSIIWSPISRR